MNNDKPIYTMDLVPSPGSFGVTGFILAFASIIFVVWLSVEYGFMALVAGVLIFTFMGFAGREFENTHHKNVMSHLPQDVQDLYNKTAKQIVLDEKEKHGKTDSNSDQ